MLHFHQITLVDIIIAFWLILICFHVSRIIAIQLKNKDHLWGQPSIHPLLFYSGKAALWLQWLLAAYWLGRRYLNENPPVWHFDFLIIILVLLSAVFLHFSHLTMSQALKPGLPLKPAGLRTGGIYKISRNPMHLGAYFFGLACLLYAWSEFNFFLFCWMIMTHHLMILAEEKYLAKTYGSAWQNYKSRTARYLIKWT
jgi:protein-S-isoprenylcysteine O-methyltransferase Ste14